MNDFEQFCYDTICTALAAIDTQVTPDIYALSFYMSDIDDDPRQPVLQLGYNTRTQVAQSAASASDAEEATWNYAFWLQNELTFVGEPGTQGAQLLQDLLQAKGLWYSDEDEAEHFDHCMLKAGDMTACFVDACVRVAQALHATGVIEQQFSRPVPIVVHGLEYYDAIALQTRLANPPGLTQAFEDWIASM